MKIFKQEISRMGDLIEFRNAQIADYKPIAKLNADNWKVHYLGIYSDHFLSYEVDSERLTAWKNRFHLPSKNQRVIVAIKDKSLVGFYCAFLGIDSQYGTLIDNLHVSSGFQRSGIGLLLFKDCANYILKYLDNKKVFLWVYELNKNAILFYERIGGKYQGTKEEILNDGTVARVCLYSWEINNKFSF